MPTTHPPTPRQRALGDRVRAARADLGISQEGLALRSGLNRSYMASLEAGQRNPSLETMCKLALALDCPLARLVADLEHESGRPQGP